MMGGASPIPANRQTLKENGGWGETNTLNEQGLANASMLTACRRWRAESAKAVTRRHMKLGGMPLVEYTGDEATVEIGP